MPTYDYVCRDCSHEFELFQAMTDPIKRKCPECKKLRLDRLIGTGACVIFKGSGFYETDYRSDAYKESKRKAEGGGDKNKPAEKQSDGASPTAKKDSDASSSSSSSCNEGGAGSPGKGPRSKASATDRGRKLGGD